MSSSSPTRRPASRTGAHPAGKPKGAALKEREAARRALAASARNRASRRRRLTTTLAPIGAVVAVLAVLVAIRLGTSQDHAGKKSRADSAAVVAQVTGVPAGALDAAGAPAKAGAAITAISDPLTANGKPRVLYVGAEYCPYCAAERWPLIVALSRFGTWQGLRYGYSGAAPEPFPNTATFTFHGATFTSPYVAFSGVETETNRQVNGRYETLDRLGAGDTAIMKKYDPDGSIPFTDLGGRWVVLGATYDPNTIHGRTHAQIAATLAQPGSGSGRAIDRAANVLTAAICRSTGGQPAAVCTSTGVVAAGKTLP